MPKASSPRSSVTAPNQRGVATTELRGGFMKAVEPGVRDSSPLAPENLAGNEDAANRTVPVCSQADNVSGKSPRQSLRPPPLGPSGPAEFADVPPPANRRVVRSPPRRRETVDAARSNSPTPTGVEAWGAQQEQGEVRPRRRLARSPVRRSDASTTSVHSSHQPCPTQEISEGLDGSPNDLEKARALFELFCREGRAACDWRKNDLRLINTHVLPELFCGRARIDWAHPRAALDELERLVTEMQANDLGSPVDVDRPAVVGSTQSRLRTSTPESPSKRAQSGSRGPVGSMIPIHQQQYQAGSTQSRNGRVLLAEWRAPQQHHPRDPSGGLGADSTPPGEPWRASRQSFMSERVTSESKSPRIGFKPSPVSPGGTPRASHKEQISDLEWHVANTELGIRQWLTELREAVRHDAYAVSP